MSGQIKCYMSPVTGSTFMKLWYKQQLLRQNSRKHPRVLLKRLHTLLEFLSPQKLTDTCVAHVSVKFYYTHLHTHIYTLELMIFQEYSIAIAIKVLQSQLSQAGISQVIIFEPNKDEVRILKLVFQQIQDMLSGHWTGFIIRCGGSGLFNTCYDIYPMYLTHWNTCTKGLNYRTD